MPEEVKSGCAPSECGTKAACEGCSFNHSASAGQAAPEKPGPLFWSEKA